MKFLKVQIFVNNTHSIQDAFKSGKYRSFPLEINPTSSKPTKPVVQKKEDGNIFGKKDYKYRKKKLKSIMRDNPPERDDFVPLPPSMINFCFRLTLKRI
jgi:hypothetical protein